MINKAQNTGKNLSRNELPERRMLTFAVTVIKLLDKEPALSPRIADQLNRSCSSVGANYAEACNASSKPDFRNKIFIAKKRSSRN